MAEEHQPIRTFRLALKVPFSVVTYLMFYNITICVHSVSMTKVHPLLLLLASFFPCISNDSLR